MTLCCFLLSVLFGDDWESVFTFTCASKFMEIKEEWMDLCFPTDLSCDSD